MGKETDKNIYIDVADPRDYPEGLIVAARVQVNELFKSKFDSDMNDKQKIAVDQGVALWLRSGRDPRKSNDVFKNPLSGDFLTPSDIMDGIFSSKRLQFSRSIRIIVDKICPNVVKAYKNLQEVESILRGQRPSGVVVPGDPELCDPKRGVAGIGGTSPFVWEPEANPKGLGYVQGKPKDD